MRNILILEDDFVFREFLAEKLSNYGRVFQASTLAQALSIMEKVKPGFLFIDLDLEENLQGLIFLEECEYGIKTVISSHEGDQVIEKAFKKGADHYFHKKELVDELEKNLREIVFKKEINIEGLYQTQDEELSERITETVNFFTSARGALLIEGESGVGKGQLVKNLCRNMKLIHINLSEYSNGTIESELFGHKKGAFTGAVRDHKGIFEKADNGILFLDEIGTLDLSIQKKLLRVIEEKSFYPVGSEELVSSNFQLITATCDNLEKLVDQGKFREDLLFRLKGHSLIIKPLRERTLDIEAFIANHLKMSSRKFYLSNEAMKLLVNHDWRGNYRELSNFMDKIHCFKDSRIKEENILKQLGRGKCIAVGDSDIYGSVKRIGLGETIKSIEKMAYSKAMKESSNRVNEAIRLLQISKSLFYRIQEEVNTAS